MKRSATFTPATFPDAMQPGEYFRGPNGVQIACIACGVEQLIEHLDLIHPCASSSCPAVYWVGLVGATRPQA